MNKHELTTAFWLADAPASYYPIPHNPQGPHNSNTRIKKKNAQNQNSLKNKHSKKHKQKTPAETPTKILTRTLKKTLKTLSKQPAN